MGELLRLLYFIVVILPLTLILIGPLLVLAALRGVQRAGPIVFEPGRQGLGGRVLALLLGLLLWLTVWGGLVILLTWAALLSTPAGHPAGVIHVTPTASRTLVPTFTPTPAPSPMMTPSPTMTLSPTPLPPPTPTNTPVGETPSPSPPPTPSPVPPTPTPAPLTATSTPTLPPLPPPTPTVPPSPSAQPPVGTPTPVATLSPDQAAEAIAAVEAANELLRAAVVEPSLGNLAALETVWRGEALADTQAFAQDLYRRYLHPLEVTFVYLIPPVVVEGSSSGMAVVTSTEMWTYKGPQSSRSESFEFTYTLTRQDGSWVITSYDYRRVSSGMPTTF